MSLHIQHEFQVFQPLLYLLSQSKKILSNFGDFSVAETVLV